MTAAAPWRGQRQPRSAKGARCTRFVPDCRAAVPFGIARPPKYLKEIDDFCVCCQVANSDKMNFQRKTGSNPCDGELARAETNLRVPRLPSGSLRHKAAQCSNLIRARPP